MKSRKFRLFIITLIVLLCTANLSVAMDTCLIQKNNEHIVIICGLPCPDCETTMHVIDKTIGDWKAVSTHLCESYKGCIITVYERNGAITYKCSKCGGTYVKHYTQTKTKHSIKH
ncbi:hypothetical protein PV797_16115 [Clostridiaceae bacterium M8S5]|nr:hypothetical protein PV797_16115 [Clostridiaceae bacterium M8S5]